MNKEHIENKEVLEVIPVEDKAATAGVQGQPEQQQRQFVRGDRSIQNKNRRFGQGGPQSGTGTQQRRPFGSHQGMGPRNPKDDFVSETLEVRRVAKTTTGGKKLSFSALVAIGNKDGTIGIGKGKDTEVSGAINKALNDAHKNLVRISRFRNTIIHDVQGDFKATRILLKKARRGTGCISCNVVKSIMRLAGVEDLVAKVIGSSNLSNVVKALLDGINKLESPKSIALRRGKTLEEILRNVVNKNHKTQSSEETQGSQKKFVKRNR